MHLASVLNSFTPVSARAVLYIYSLFLSTKFFTSFKRNVRGSKRKQNLYECQKGGGSFTDLY